jgi:hypothetical protein
MRTTLLTLAFALSLAAVSGSAAPPPIQCGSTLGPGGEYKLTSDLTCVTDGVTLVDGAVLNLADHTITGGIFAIKMTGHGTVVRNGTVIGSEGSQNSQILNNYFESPTGGAIVMNEGIAVPNSFGTGATISGNYIVCNDGCINIFGPAARVIDNVISCAPSACAGPGILVIDFFDDTADANVIARNEIKGFNVGIDVHSIHNLIERNDECARVG